MTTRLSLDRLRDDTGAYAVLYAFLLVVFIGVAAIVIDIGSMRLDRRTDRTATDAAAMAGAIALGQTLSPDPQNACAAAFKYAQDDLHLSSLSNDCQGTFPASFASCPATASSATGSSTLGVDVYTVTVTWPVPDSSPLMTPDLRPGPSPAQPVVAADGSPCQRVGVTISRQRGLIFAPIWGNHAATTSDHSVAVQSINQGPGEIAAPLVILDPTACNALTAEGGGGVIVAPNDSVAPGVPGLIAVNSSGTGNQCPVPPTGSPPPGPFVVNSNSASGSNSAIWAEDSATGGLAKILIFALTQGNTDGYQPTQVTCTSSNPPTGPLCPHPSALLGQISRLAFMDNNYNCTIEPAPCASTDVKAGISQFRSMAEYLNANPTAMCATTGWTCVSGKKSCSNPASAYTGNVYVNCTANNGGFSVSATTTFAGNANGTPSSVIFAGDVTVQSGGCLLFNVPAANASNACTNPSSLAAPPADGPTVFVTGTLSVNSTNSSLIAPQTFVMEGDCNTAGTTCTGSTTPALNLSTNGTGNILWSAPLGLATCTPGTTTVAPTPGCFAKLAYWNEFATPANNPNNSIDNVSGQAALLLQGTFFTPNAQVVLSGGSSTNIRSAQFVTGRLDVHGGAVLTMVPDASHTNSAPILVGTLIR